MRSPSRSPIGPGPRGRGADERQRPIAAALKLSEDHVVAIDASHERCAALGVSRIERPDLTPLGRSDLALTRERNLRLHDHAAPVMEMLHEQISASQSMVVLTDAAGTILHSIGDDDFLERASKVALRPGANWSEPSKGTNAVGTALVQETPTLVHADEHYLHANHFLTCSAAPILDPRGNILGVLDVSGDYRGYHQHTMALVNMSARMIENRWLSDDHRNVMRLHLHSRVEFIGTLMEGLLAVGVDGRIVGANRGALEQLGLTGAAVRQHTLGSLLGTSVGALVDRFRSPLAMPLATTTLVNGRRIHLLARFNWPVWSSLTEAVSGLPPAAAPTPAAPAPAIAPAGPTGTALALPALLSGDAAFDAVVDKVRRIVDSDIPLLISGETGTGKDLLAHALHADSHRRAQPFVTVHCAAVPAVRLEADLFGDVEADPARPPADSGKLAAARGGTLFLDDIDEMPPVVQGRLLRWLKDAAVTPLAIVATSRQPLREPVDRQQFREDLYYRLSGLTVRLPPLRERSDLVALVQRLLERESPGRHVTVAADVMALFRRCRWPGNLRQLGNLLHSACVMAGTQATITREHLPEDFLADDSSAAPAPLAASDAAQAAAPAAAARTLGDMEIDAIRQAVADSGGNISEAAKRLGVSRNTIYRRLRWLG